MPIRTNRGRAAVYRKLWGWPLRSPRHLAVAAFVAVLLITAAGVVIPRLTGASGGAATAGTGGASTPATEGMAPGAPRPGGTGGVATSLPTRVASPTLTPSSAPPAPEAVQVAKDWAAAWVNHPEGTTAEQWLAGLRPHTTEEYMAVMDSVDPANVPARQIAGEPEVVLSHPKSVEVEVPTDGPRLRLTVIQTDRGWRVANYEQGE